MVEQQLALFDYNALDRDTRFLIEMRTIEIKGLMKRAAEDIIEIGHKLIEVKTTLGHGKFGSWLLTEFEWHYNTAGNFMRVAEQFKNTKFVNLDLAPSALYLLAAPSTPDIAREEAIFRAEAGEQITYSKAKEIVEWNKNQVSKLVAQENEVSAQFNSPTPEPAIQSFDTWANDPNPPYEVDDEEELPEPLIELAPAPAPLQPQSMTLLTSSQNDSWRTPARYIEAVHQVLKGIDLDPASTAIANETVRAMQYLTKEDDGLSQPWFGTVFCNPPYGKTNNLSNQGLFAHKLVTEYIAGNVIEGIILVNLYSGYGWFAPLRTLPMCLVDHRISFIDPATDAEGDEAKASSVFIYVGKDPRKFYQVFKQFGPCGQFSYDW